jgi:hypothetical protein
LVPGLPDGLYIFIPKIPILVYFSGLGMKNFWRASWQFGIFIAILVYSMAVWYFHCRFGIFFPFWSVVPSKIWQPGWFPLAYVHDQNHSLGLHYEAIKSDRKFNGNGKVKQKVGTVVKIRGL